MMTMQPSDAVEQAEAIATEVADRCHGERKPGEAATRYAIIWQAARLGAIAALTAQAKENDHASE